MSNLRSKVIRLASEHPEFRRDLLPILREASKTSVIDFLRDFLEDEVSADKMADFIDRLEDARGKVTRKVVQRAAEAAGFMDSSIDYAASGFDEWESRG